MKRGQKNTTVKNRTETREKNCDGEHTGKKNVKLFISENFTQSSEKLLQKKLFPTSNSANFSWWVEGHNYFPAVLKISQLEIRKRNHKSGHLCGRGCGGTG